MTSTTKTKWNLQCSLRPLNLEYSFSVLHSCLLLLQVQMCFTLKTSKSLLSIHNIHCTYDSLSRSRERLGRFQWYTYLSSACWKLFHVTSTTKTKWNLKCSLRPLNLEYSFSVLDSCLLLLQVQMRFTLKTRKKFAVYPQYPLHLRFFIKVTRSREI